MIKVKRLKRWTALCLLGGLVAGPAAADHMMMGPMMGDTGEMMTGPWGMEMGSGMGWGMMRQGMMMQGPAAIPNLTEEQRKQ
jgi:hypothetical protein